MHDQENQKKYDKVPGGLSLTAAKSGLAKFEGRLTFKSSIESS